MANSILHRTFAELEFYSGIPDLMPFVLLES
jgi:hypothetical protein